MAGMLEHLGADVDAAVKLLRAGKGAAVDSTLALLTDVANRARAMEAGSDALFTRPDAADVLRDMERADEVIPLPYPIEQVPGGGLVYQYPWARLLLLPEQPVTARR